MSQTMVRDFVVPSTADDYTPVAALVNADFDKSVFLNGASQGTVPTITETPAGFYHFSYTFPTAGSWSIVISNDTNEFRHTWEFELTVLTIDDERPHTL